jgi:transposase InsO family protein
MLALIWIILSAIRDNDALYSLAFRRRLRAMGIRDRPIAPGSPWQNGMGLIGSIRRECLDHVLIFSEVHLQRVLREYAGYYNTARTHRSLEKDAPISRAVQRAGKMVSRSILGGLHHQYVRV